MSSERAILITESEAWTIDDVIRHTWTEEGRNVGQSLLLKVFAVLREFDARQPSAPEVLPVALTEEECWAIDCHIRRNHIDLLGVPVGRPLLLKVFGALLGLRDAQAVDVMRFAEAPGGEDDAEKRRRLEDFRRSLGADEREEGAPGG